jgi:hypothetical protein
MDDIKYSFEVSNFYENAFAKYKELPISLLEIGIARGYSLLLWNKYFINNITICGVDNYNMTSIEVQNNDKIKKIFADAYDSNTANILPSFDVIIDDGPHTLESQEKAIQLYLPKVNILCLCF